MRPRHPIPLIIDYYSPREWYYAEPSALDTLVGQPLYVCSGRLMYALWFVESLPDDLRGEAVYEFIEHLNEVAAIAA